MTKDGLKKLHAIRINRLRVVGGVNGRVLLSIPRVPLMNGAFITYDFLRGENMAEGKNFKFF